MESVESTIYVTPRRVSNKLEMPVNIDLNKIGVPGIRELVAMIKGLQHGQSKILENQDFIKDRLDRMENDMVNLKDRIDTVSKAGEENSAEINVAREELEKHSDEIEELRFEQNRQEQYSRKASFRIFGVAEEADEAVEEKSINIIKEEIGVEVDAQEIDIVHRTGKRRSDGKPRAILVKCLSHKTKAKVMKEKRKAKNVTFREDLAHGILEYFNNILDKKEELGIESVWTIDGKIRCKFQGNDSVFHVNSFNDYNDLIRGLINE